MKSTRSALITQRRSILAAFVGTAIEWYDFFLFGTAAALVFGTVFYPDLAPGAGLLASFATFWVGFLARPIGGIIFSHFGDRFGRKNVLIVTLSLMGLATTCIGLLPTFAQVGMLAPVLLIVLRAVQGLAVGGEWGGAVVLATENATKGKRGLAGAWVQQGSPAGSILSTCAFMLVGMLDDEAFLAWGWRVPFLFSAVLLIIAFVIRLKVEETEDFKTTEAKGEVPRLPVLEAFRVAPMLIVFGVLGAIMSASWSYFNNPVMLSWTTELLGMDRGLILQILLLSAIVQFAWQPLVAKLAERYGIRTMMIGGLIVTAVVTPFYFIAIQSADALFIGAMLVISTLGACAYYAMLATALSNAFSTRIRYTGVTLAYQLCSMIFGGSTSFLAQWLLNTSGPWAVMSFYLALVALTIFGVLGVFRYGMAHVAQAEPVDGRKGTDPMRLDSP